MIAQLVGISSIELEGAIAAQEEKMIDGVHGDIRRHLAISLLALDPSSDARWVYIDWKRRPYKNVTLISHAHHPGFY